MEPRRDDLESEIFYDILLEAIREQDCITTGRVETHGCTYHWARFGGQMRVDETEALRWCEGQLGPEEVVDPVGGPIDQPRWFELGGKYYFRDHPDFVLFMVRWG